MRQTDTTRHPVHAELLRLVNEAFEVCGITVTDLANLIGRSPSYTGHVLSGYCPLSLGLAAMICEACGMQLRLAIEPRDYIEEQEG